MIVLAMLQPLYAWAEARAFMRALDRIWGLIEARE